MLGASTIEGLELTNDALEKCPWTISTSMEGTEHATGITKIELSFQLNPDNVEDASFMKVKAIVTEAKSYDVLVGSTVLYHMGFTLDFWEETANYRPGWQAGDTRYQLDLFEFLLVTLLICMLSLALWIQIHFGSWKILMTMPLLLTPT
jgi:hypothetical protein